MAFSCTFFNCNDEPAWDNFMLNKSMNGTFLQTRKFINYHKDGKFQDCSVIIRKGSEIVALILACVVEEEGKKTFFAHKGTTFGGITIAKSVYSASSIDEITKALLFFLQENGFQKIYLKMVPNLYQRENTDLLDYFLVKNDFKCYNELNYYLDLRKYRDDIAAQFSSSKRRDYRYSLKSGFTFRKLDTREEIAAYYQILLMNLNKLGLKPVHTLDDLFDLKFNRFEDRIEFFGVYKEREMVAGSMLFRFNDKLVHTQYLSSDENYLKFFPMDFLIYNLIESAINCGMEIFSFGICTENQGRYLNLGLSRFKEGFGTQFCINRCYEKDL